MFKYIMALLSVVIVSACVPINKPLQKAMVYSDEDRIDSLTVKYTGYCSINEIRIYKQLFFLWGLGMQEPSELVFKAKPKGRSSAETHYAKDYNIDVLKLFNTYYKYSKTVDIRDNKLFSISYKIEDLDSNYSVIEKNGKEFEITYDTQYTGHDTLEKVRRLDIATIDKGFSYHKVTKELDLYCVDGDSPNSYKNDLIEHRKKDANTLLEDFIGIDIDTKSTYGVFIPGVAIIDIGEH